VEVTIRRATAGDQSGITALVRGARLNPRALGWPGFVVAVGPPGIVGVAQIRRHADGGHELASLVVLPDLRGQGIAARMIETLLADANSPTYTLIDQRYLPHFGRWGFRLVEPATLPRSLRQQYRIGRVVTSVASLLRRDRIRIVPLLREVPAKPAG
jgi:N-acetylglutamate synthase-like GNAT family acetyltransferase